MEQRYEIIVELVDGSRVYLDTYKAEPVNITYNVSDIIDISSRNSSYSKTITLPETPNNREVFNYISDLSSVSSFNPNKKAKAYILVDTIQIFEGFIQLRKVIVDDEGDVKLECVIFGDNDNLFKNIGDGFLTDLDMSDYNHDWTIQAITASWYGDYKLGYYYPLVDYGNDWDLADLQSNICTINRLFPATYIKTIFDRIIYEAGYSYKSNFLSGSTFSNLIMPFTKEKLEKDPLSAQVNRFYAGVTPSVNINKTTSQLCAATVVPGGSGKGGGTTTITDNPLGISVGTYRIRFNDDSNIPFGDPSNNWSTSNYEYTQPSSPLPGQQFTCAFDLTLGITSKPSECKIAFKRSRNPITGATVSGGVVVPVGGITTPMKFSTVPGATVVLTSSLYGGGTAKGTIQCDPVNLFTGEKLWVEVEVIIFTNYTRAVVAAFPGSYGLTSYVFASVIAGATYTTSYVVMTQNTGTSIYNDIPSYLISGQTIDYNKVLPTNIKKRDFITSIIKMFNLIVEPNKEFQNSLYIEPRDAYYESGTIKYWTKKIDLLDPIEEQILGETQNKRTLFTYKEDKDFWNNLYKSDTNEIYGQYNYEIDNDFIKGEKKIDVIFSPTPLIALPQSNEIILGQILKDKTSVNKFISPNIRILYKKLVPLPTETWKLWDVVGTASTPSTPYTQTSYPYAGHYDNPFNPQIDINWGQIRGAYDNITANIVTDNNLFSLYYDKMMSEFSDSDSRIVTLSMYLSPYDINNFRFNDKIFLTIGGSGQYYKVNKIEGYDPGEVKTCKVELIKTKYITVPRVRRPARPVYVINDKWKIANSNTNVARGNVPTGSQKAGTSTYGNYNSVVGNTITLGDNNTQSARSMVIGNNNTVEYTAEGSLIFGNNVRVSEPNTIYLSGKIVNSMSYISASRDEVLSPFSDGVVNYISASRDWIRELGSHDTIQIISSGRDSIL